MKVVLLGGKGMFGRDAAPLFEKEGCTVHDGDLPEVDVTDATSLGRFLDMVPSEVVINAAAFTDVDGAESHREEAFRVNASGARRVAEACRERGLTLVQVSTDYVFPGTRPEGYHPHDLPSPAANAYGESKLEGERAVMEILPPDRYLICRTQWLYGRHGRNFVDTILRLASERPELKVVDDQWGVPTHTEELARQMLALLEMKVRGVAHAVGGGGPITWFALAREVVVLSNLPCRVTPCSSEEFPRPAHRPSHAWLKNGHLPQERITHWRETLAGYLRSRSASG
jgi:dTDP-4-dehydrorhamnose reductase